MKPFFKRLWAAFVIAAFGPLFILSVFPVNAWDALRGELGQVAKHLGFWFTVKEAVKQDIRWYIEASSDIYQDLFRAGWPKS